MDWSKTHVFYVNHKAVALTDGDSTHKKAKEIFLDKVRVWERGFTYLRGEGFKTGRGGV